MWSLRSEVFRRPWFRPEPFSFLAEREKEIGRCVFDRAAPTRTDTKSSDDFGMTKNLRLRLPERDRRPTQNELDRIISTLDANVRQQIPVGRIIRFAVATATRQDEIARVEWRDFDANGRMLLIRNRKDPRKKKGNDQRIPLLDVSGYDACKIIEERKCFGDTLT